MTVHATISPKATRVAEFDARRVRRLSIAVYRDRLGHGGAERMIEQDNDDGERLSERAAGYDSLSRSYLRAIAEVS